MLILVCISLVPYTTSQINFTNRDSEFDTHGVQFVINPNDEFGLTRAIWFQEQQGANVTVVNVGGPDTEPTLRKALAIGANEAIRVNANPTDGFFVAKQLAEVIKNGGYDLVIAGKESLDYNGGMVPGMLAGLLGFNFVNSCIELTVDGTSCKASREIDGGKEIVSTSLPLIIGGQRGMEEEKDLRPEVQHIIAHIKMDIGVNNILDQPPLVDNIMPEKFPKTINVNQPINTINTLNPLVDSPASYDVHAVEESLSLAYVERELIIKALKKHKGRRRDAAKDLGISERTLYRKIDEYNIVS